MREIGEAREVREFIFHLEGNPIRQAQAIRNLLDKDMTEKDVARLLGWSQQKVSARLRLLTLHPELQERAAKGKLAVSTAYRLAMLPDQDQRRFLGKEAITLDEAKKAQRRTWFLSQPLLEILDTPMPETGGENTLTCPKCGHTFSR